MLAVGAEMTASGFRVARVPPLVGRLLVEEDERVGAPDVVVIGHRIWRTHFDSDPAVVGRTVRLGTTIHTVVGVMPERFAFLMNQHFWLPLRANPLDYERRQGPEIITFGRLAQGVTLQQARADRHRIVGQLFVEALVLSAVSVAAGLALASLALQQADVAVRHVGDLVLRGLHRD